MKQKSTVKDGGKLTSKKWFASDFFETIPSVETKRTSKWVCLGAKIDLLSCRTRSTYDVAVCLLYAQN